MHLTKCMSIAASTICYIIEKGFLEKWGKPCMCVCVEKEMRGRLLLATLPVRQSGMWLQDKERRLYQGVQDTTDMR